MEERAYAKLNLSLDVLGKRADGYHDLQMVMETVDLFDTLRLERLGQGLRVSSNLSFLPTDQSNLAAVAVRRFQEATGLSVEPLSVHIEKRIPVCAGMAGGSSDAAAVLRCLDRSLGTELSLLELQAIGAKVGSDVPYCVAGGTALAEGRGEVLTPLPALPRCAFVLCKPPFSVSTPTLFEAWDRKRQKRRPDTKGMLAALEAGDLTQVCHRLYNVFEDVMPSRQGRQVAEVKHLLIQQGAMGAAMSGTGPTVYGIFAEDAPALLAYEALKQDYPSTFFCHNV